MSIKLDSFKQFRQAMGTRVGAECATPTLVRPTATRWGDHTDDDNP